MVEDPVRRLLGGGSVWVLGLKCAPLLLACLFSVREESRTNLRTCLLVLLVLTVPLVPHLLLLDDLSRAALWIFGAVAVPALCIGAVARLSGSDCECLGRALRNCAIVLSVTVLWAEVTGDYKVYGTLVGPSLEGKGFRMYEGERLYFNSGVLMSAERLAWVCLLGIGWCGAGAAVARGWRRSLLVAASVLLWIAAGLTSRATGFLLCSAALATVFAMLGGRLISVGALALSILLSLGVTAGLLDAVPGLRDGVSYYGFRAEESRERTETHGRAILDSARGVSLFGAGPLPQGAQYLSGYLDWLPNYNTEGLLSHSIFQFGVLAPLHLFFHAWIGFRLVHFIRRKDRALAMLAVCGILSRAWLLKASQMETDTLAQVFAFLTISPLLLLPRDRK
jgi:hypothetical protein